MARKARGCILVATVFLALLCPVWAASTEPEHKGLSATTRPSAAASMQSAGRDPNWIGPNSWERHFTLPPFTETAHGREFKTATSRPADAAGKPASYFASRSTRAASSSGTSSTPGAKSSTGKSSGSSASKSRSSSRHEKRSSSKSSRRSERKSRKSHD